MTVCVRFTEDSRGDVVDIDYFCSGFCFTAATGDPSFGHEWPGGAETDCAVFCANCGDLMWHGLESSEHLEQRAREYVTVDGPVLDRDCYGTSDDGEEVK